MPQKGSRQPWKVRYQYPDRPEYTIAKGGLPAAVTEMLQLRRRGAKSTISFVDKENRTNKDFSDAELLVGLRSYGPMYDYLVEELEETDESEWMV